MLSFVLEKDEQQSRTNGKLLSTVFIIIEVINIRINDGAIDETKK